MSMRMIAVLLTAMVIASAAAAHAAPAKAEKAGQVEATLKYINSHLDYTYDDLSSKCRNRKVVSVSGDHAEIIVRDILVDRHGKVREKVEPHYVYHVPVTAVQRVYLRGPWTRIDRVVVLTDGDAVAKYGPVWDCSQDKLSDRPAKRWQNSVELRMYDGENLNGVAKALNHLVDELQSEAKAKAAADKPAAHKPAAQESLPDSPE